MFLEFEGTLKHKERQLAAAWLPTTLKQSGTGKQNINGDKLR